MGQGYAKSNAMPTDAMPTEPPSKPASGTPERPQDSRPRLTPAAERALAEAQARRAARAGDKVDGPEEVGGRGGLDPTRYGDWEVNGLASDF
jgi:hypothetical protein